MRSTFKVLFYVNGSKEKNGIVPIMGRVTINGSVAQFSCKLTISKTMWDAKGNRAKGKSKEARDINLIGSNLNYLCSILNSKLIQWLLSLIIGEAAGGNAGNADNIWNLHIPHTNSDCNVIDSDVYALYGLTDDEIKYVEK